MYLNQLDEIILVGIYFLHEKLHEMGHVVSARKFFADLIISAKWKDITLGHPTFF